MKILFTALLILGVVLASGSGKNAEAGTHFSFNLGVVPEYYGPPIYYEPVYTPYYVVPHRYYYDVPPCYEVYEYTPYGPMYRTICH